MSGYFSGPNIGFAEAFPTIKDLQMEVITSAGITSFDKKQTFTFSTQSPPPARIPCPKGGCTGAGFDVQDFLAGMVARKEIEKTEIRMCGGQERMGKGKSRSCVGNFKITAKIEYKPPQTQTVAC